MSGRGKKRKTKYEAEEIWRRSPSPEENWGSDAEGDFGLEIIGEEVGYCGDMKYEVRWTNWHRADGTSTTWEGPDTTSQHLPTDTWEAERRSEMSNRPDIVLWGTTDIVNTGTRERKQGYEEATERERAKFQKDLDGMQRRMNELMAESEGQFPDLYRRYTRERGGTAVRPDAPPVATTVPQTRSSAAPTIPFSRRSQINAPAGPSRIQVNAEAGPSRSRTATSPAVPTSRAPAPLPTASSSRLPPPMPSMPIPPPRAPPLRRGSPAVSIASSSESIQIIGHKPAPAVSKPMPPNGAKRKATSPVPPPPAKRRLPVPCDLLPPNGSASMSNLYTAAGPSKPRPSAPAAAPASRPSSSKPSVASVASTSAIPGNSRGRTTSHASFPGPLPSPLTASRASTSTAFSPSVSASTRCPRGSSPSRASTSSSTSTLTYVPHGRVAAAQASHNSEAGRNSLKRKAPDDDLSARQCACGTPLPPPDVYRRNICSSCRKTVTNKQWSDAAGKTAASSSSAHVHTMRASTGSVRPSGAFEEVGKAPDMIPQPMPLPESMRKGKARESVKSRRLQTETMWSTAAHSRDGAAGITFVNDVDDEELPPSLRGDDWEFVYLEDEYQLSPALDIEVDPTSATLQPAGFFSFCACAECDEFERCACQDEASVSGYAYTDGLFNFTYGLHQVVVECNPYCTCPATCANRVTQRPRKVPIEVFKTARCGWGARARADVVRGQVLGVYTGNLIPRAEAEALDGEAKEYCFDLDYNEDGASVGTFYTVDSMKCGNWTRFINHSCEPNLRVQPVVYDTVPSLNMAFLAFVATKRIPAGTELTFDYDPAAQRDFELAEIEIERAARGKGKGKGRERGRWRGEVERPAGATDCVCGVARCRGWVRT